MQSETSHPFSPSHRIRSIVLLATLLTALNLRTAVTGFSVLLGEVQNALHFDAVLAGAIGTFVTACFALAAFVAPTVARRFGLERTAAIALTATTAGIIIRAIAPGPVLLVAGTVVAFVGIGASNVIIIPILREYFPNRIAVMNTTYMLLLQAGQLLAPLLAVPLSVAFGWRVAIGIWAALTAVATILWFLAFRRPPREELVVTPLDPTGTERRPTIHGLPHLGLVVTMAMNSLHTYTLVTWLPTMFMDQGMTQAAGALLLSLFAAMGFIGAFVVAPLAIKRGGPFSIVLACAALLTVGYTGMITAPVSGAAAWAICLGLGVSTFPLCLTLIARRASGSREATVVSGRVQGIGYAVGCVGPLLLGALHTSAGGWTSSYLVLLASIIVSVAGGFLASRQKPSAS